MSAQPGNGFTIFIETGLHAGAVQRLSPGIHTLGSELDADIVLSDEQVKAVHLILELDAHGLRLEPLQGAIAIQGESADLEPGGERNLRFPTSFTIGDTRIRVTAPKDSVQTKQRMRAAVITAGLAAVAVVGFQIMGPFAGAGIDGPSTMPMPIMQPLQAASSVDDRSASGATPSPKTINALREEKTEPAGGDEIGHAVPDVTLEQAAAALRERLVAEDLTGIDVKVAGDRLLVQGEAEPERMDDWQALRIWFDAAFGQAFIMVATIEAAEQATPPELAIEAVWSGDEPYLIAGGRRFFVGNHVGDGWMIENIGSEEITFKRGDTSFSLAL